MSNTGKLYRKEDLVIDTNTGNVTSFAPPIYPLKIIFKDIGELTPQEDITPYESVCLCMLLLAGWGSACSMQALDYTTFIHEHNLDRHFRPLPEETTP